MSSRESPTASPGGGSPTSSPPPPVDVTPLSRCSAAAARASSSSAVTGLVGTTVINLFDRTSEEFRDPSVVHATQPGCVFCGGSNGRTGEPCPQCRNVAFASQRWPLPAAPGGLSDAYCISPFKCFPDLCASPHGSVVPGTTDAQRVDDLTFFSCPLEKPFTQGYACRCKVSGKEYLQRLSMGTSVRETVCTSQPNTTLPDGSFDFDSVLGVPVCQRVTNSTERLRLLPIDQVREALFATPTDDSVQRAVCRGPALDTAVDCRRAFARDSLVVCGTHRPLPSPSSPSPLSPSLPSPSSPLPASPSASPGEGSPSSSPATSPSSPSASPLGFAASAASSVAVPVFSAQSPALDGRDIGRSAFDLLRASGCFSLDPQRLLRQLCQAPRAETAYAPTSTDTIVKCSTSGSAAVRTGELVCTTLVEQPIGPQVADEACLYPGGSQGFRPFRDGDPVPEVSCCCQGSRSVSRGGPKSRHLAVISAGNAGRNLSNDSGAQPAASVSVNYSTTPPTLRFCGLITSNDQPLGDARTAVFVMIAHCPATGLTRPFRICAREDRRTWYVVSETSNNPNAGDDYLTVEAGESYGFSWARPNNSLWRVLRDLAVPGDQVWVQQGIHGPKDVRNPTIGQEFLIAPGVDVFGGFAGTERDLCQRNSVLNQTELVGFQGSTSSAQWLCKFIHCEQTGNALPPPPPMGFLTDIVDATDALALCEGVSLAPSDTLPQQFPLNGKLFNVDQYGEFASDFIDYTDDQELGDFSQDILFPGTERHFVMCARTFAIVPPGTWTVAVGTKDGSLLRLTGAYEVLERFHQWRPNVGGSCPPVTLTAVSVVNLSQNVACTSTAALAIGMILSGSFAPVGATVSMILNATTFQMSVAAGTTAGGLTWMATTAGYPIGAPLCRADPVPTDTADTVVQNAPLWPTGDPNHCPSWDLQRSGVVFKTSNSVVIEIYAICYHRGEPLPATSPQLVRVNPGASFEVSVAEGQYNLCSDLSRFQLLRDGAFGWKIAQTRPDIPPSRHIVFFAESSLYSNELASRIDGFVVRENSATGASPDDRGAGVLVDQRRSNVTVENCTFYNLSASERGGKRGGALASNGAANLSILGCTFGVVPFVVTSSSPSGSPGSPGSPTGPIAPPAAATDTLISAEGGGAVFIDGGLNASVLIDRCLFSNSTSSGFGGAVALRNVNRALIMHSRFTNNTAGQYGGALSISQTQTSGSRRTLIYYCEFANNHVTSEFFGPSPASPGDFDALLQIPVGGGAIGIVNQKSGTLDVEIANCLFRTNSTLLADTRQRGGGGAMLAHGVCKVECKLSTVYANCATANGGAFRLQREGPRTPFCIISNTLFWRNGPCPTAETLFAMYDPTGLLSSATPVPASFIFSGFAATNLTQTGYPPSFNTNVWQVGGPIASSPAPVLSQYVAFKLIPPMAGIAHYTTVRYSRRSFNGGGAQSASLRSSADGFVADLATLTGLDQGPVSDELVFDVSQTLADQTSMIEFRLYFYAGGPSVDWSSLLGTLAGGQGLRVYGFFDPSSSPPAETGGGFTLFRNSTAETLSPDAFTTPNPFYRIVNALRDTNTGYLLDPQFERDPYDPRIVVPDLHLQVTSDAIDSGNNDAALLSVTPTANATANQQPVAVPTDFDGNMRRQQGRPVPQAAAQGNAQNSSVDYGAYEFCLTNAPAAFPHAIAVFDEPLDGTVSSLFAPIETNWADLAADALLWAAHDALQQEARCGTPHDPLPTPFPSIVALLPASAAALGTSLPEPELVPPSPPESPASLFDGALDASVLQQLLQGGDRLVLLDVTAVQLKRALELGLWDDGQSPASGRDPLHVSNLVVEFQTTGAPLAWSPASPPPPAGSLCRYTVTEEGARVRTVHIRTSPPFRVGGPSSAPDEDRLVVQNGVALHPDEHIWVITTDRAVDEYFAKWCPRGFEKRLRTFCRSHTQALRDYLGRWLSGQIRTAQGYGSTPLVGTDRLLPLP